jgi:hypothetical protein
MRRSSRPASAEAEQRAARQARVPRQPEPTDGQGGYFSPPLWLIDHFAGAPRPMRSLAALIPNLPLPRGASEVKLPRMTTGTHAADRETARRSRRRT